MSTPILSLTRVSKTYRRGSEEVHALREVTLSLRSGEVVALVGPSGSGKTTLLMIAAGWERPDSGGVRSNDSRNPAETRWRDVSLIPQRLGLVDELTVAENVGLPLLLDAGPKAANDERIAGLLKALDLSSVAARRPPETSLGEQQRTATARALALAPSLVLADEPTGHQDARREALVLHALHGVAARGGSCLIATHNDATIEYCHRVVFIEDGAISSDERRAGGVSAALWGRRPDRG